MNVSCSFVDSLDHGSVLARLLSELGHHTAGMLEPALGKGGACSSTVPILLDSMQHGQAMWAASTLWVTTRLPLLLASLRFPGLFLP